LTQPPQVEIFHPETGTALKARLCDLSRGGCQVETDYVLPLETEVTIKLTKSGDEVEAKARIVRVMPNKGFGLAFTSMEGNGFRILDSWLATFIATTWVAANRRRMQRAAMQVHVRVSGYSAGGKRFTQDTATVEISPMGCSVNLQSSVRIGQRLVLTNVKTNVTVECMVASHILKETVSEVGLAFTVPNESFWPIVFPPANLSSRETKTK
jgi:hypothetical protein